MQLPSFLGWVIVGVLFVFSWGGGKAEVGVGLAGEGGGLCFYHCTEKIDGC